MSEYPLTLLRFWRLACQRAWRKIAPDWWKALIGITFFIAIAEWLGVNLDWPEQWVAVIALVFGTIGAFVFYLFRAVPELYLESQNRIDDLCAKLSELARDPLKSSHCGEAART